MSRIEQLESILEDIEEKIRELEEEEYARQEMIKDKEDLIDAMWHIKDTITILKKVEL